MSIQNKERVTFRNKNLYTIAKEELFLEKMIGASFEGRAKKKQKRDKKAVAILRKKVNERKLKKDFRNTSCTILYWRLMNLFVLQNK